MLKKIILISAFLTLSAVSVFAIRCEQLTVREEFEQSDLAMTVRIESFKKVSLRTGEKPSIVSALMIVEKVYKGAYKPGAKLRFASLGQYAGGFGFKDSDLGRRMLSHSGGVCAAVQTTAATPERRAAAAPRRARAARPRSAACRASTA